MITTIFMPLTLLAGIFGMSEWTVMTGGEENIRSSYPFFGGIMLLIGAANFIVLKWLEKRDWKKLL
jgi:magnesium transporter